MKLFSKGIKLSLRAKLTILIEGFVVILVCVTGFFITMREEKTLESELRKRGLALTSDVAKFMARPLLSHDFTTLRRFVNHSMEQEYVRYVIVFDPYGKVLMHSDLAEVGKTYTDSLTISAINSIGPGYTDVHASKNEGLHCDMFTPIKVSNVQLGTVQLGYSHMAVEKEIDEIQKKIFILGLLTTISGGVVAFLLASLISSPIKRITYATEKVANGYFNTQLMIKRNDEIGTLANAFNKMTEDLRRTTVSKEYFDNIIKSMNDTLIVVGPDAKIRSVNKAACVLLEYNEDELTGKDINLIVPQEEMIFRDLRFQKLLHDAPVTNYELEYITKSGKRIPMLFSAAVLKNKEGKLEGAVCIARDIKERKKVEEALRESERELHFLSSQLLTAQEKERKRLSIELHDELGQSLMVLKLKLRSIREELRNDQSGLIAQCDEVIGYIKEVTENVRRLSMDLSPSILEDLGLSAAIQWLVDNFNKHYGIECSLEMMALEKLFSQEYQITIYRIIQECLTNIAKHAQATHVSISIKKKDGQVNFLLEDNGKGFNVKEILSKDLSKKGLGLSAMYERIRMIGASLDIWSQEGSGTKITFTIPIKAGGI